MSATILLLYLLGWLFVIQVIFFCMREMKLVVQPENLEFFFIGHYILIFTYHLNILICHIKIVDW